MAEPSGALETTLIILAVIVFVVARRTYAQVAGATYSPVRLYGFAALAGVFFLLFASSTALLAFATWGGLAAIVIVADGVALAGCAVGARPQVQRAVRFETRPDGLVYYRLPWVIPVLYLVLFVARLGVEFLLLGPGAFGTFGGSSHVAPTVLLVLIGFDLLYAVSLGLLLGRAAGVSAAYRTYAARRATRSSTP